MAEELEGEGRQAADLINQGAGDCAPISAARCLVTHAASGCGHCQLMCWRAGVGAERL